MGLTQQARADAVRTDRLLSRAGGAVGGSDGEGVAFVVLPRGAAGATHHLVFPHSVGDDGAEGLRDSDDIAIIDVVVERQHVEEFAELAEANAVSSVAEAGCARFELWRSAAEPGRFVLFKAYRDRLKRRYLVEDGGAPANPLSDLGSASASSPTESSHWSLSDSAHTHDWSPPGSPLCDPAPVTAPAAPPQGGAPPSATGGA
eukprot:gene20725-38884_t